MLHPQARAFLDSVAEANSPGWNEMSLEEARTTFASLDDRFGPGPDVAFSDLVVGECSCRVYRPVADEDLPLLMYFHGGGWVLGDLETHRSLCSKLAAGANCVVVAVNYRKAPENPFPAAFNDCYAATEYFAANATRFGIDASRLAVAGDSAGGNLAAAVALKARDTDGPRICHQTIIYGAMDAGDQTESYQAFAEDHGLTREVMQWFWQQYLQDKQDGSNPYACPNTADDFAGLPPAHVITAEYDVLRDEGEAYAQRLKASGVPTVLKRYDGMLHGFVHFAEPFDDADVAVNDVARVLRKAFNAG